MNRRKIHDEPNVIALSHHRWFTALGANTALIAGEVVAASEATREASIDELSSD